jgi:hypothetical protein
VRCRNNEQNRINNRHVATTNKIESTTDMSKQQTKLNPQQRCRNNEQNRINNRHAATTNRTGSTSKHTATISRHTVMINRTAATISKVDGSRTIGRISWELNVETFPQARLLPLRTFLTSRAQTSDLGDTEVAGRCRPLQLKVIRSRAFSEPFHFLLKLLSDSQRFPGLECSWCEKVSGTFRSSLKN